MNTVCELSQVLLILMEYDRDEDGRLGPTEALSLLRDVWGLVVASRCGEEVWGCVGCGGGPQVWGRGSRWTWLAGVLMGLMFDGDVVHS